MCQVSDLVNCLLIEAQQGDLTSIAAMLDVCEEHDIPVPILGWCVNCHCPVHEQAVVKCCEFQETLLARCDIVLISQSDLIWVCDPDRRDWRISKCQNRTVQWHINELKKRKYLLMAETYEDGEQHFYFWKRGVYVTRHLRFR